MIKTITATVLFTSIAFAQSEAVQMDKMKAEMQTRLNIVTGNLSIISSERSSAPIVAGAPYSAEEIDTTTQTLFDGNRIVHSSTTKVYRDQQGRTRVERSLSNIGSLAAGQPLVHITINDPVANAAYDLEPESKIAHKLPMQINESSTEAATLQKLKRVTEEIALSEAGAKVIRIENGSAMNERNVKREDLGASNMAGVPVKGTRSTIVIPAGTMGNDRDINIVDERWYSPDLKMNIMTKHSDPRMGETVFQVNNLSRANPDPSLFQVPPDYQIKEGGPRTLKFDTKKD